MADIAFTRIVVLHAHELAIQRMTFNRFKIRTHARDTLFPSKIPSALVKFLYPTDNAEQREQPEAPCTADRLIPRQEEPAYAELSRAVWRELHIIAMICLSALLVAVTMRMR